MKWIKKGIAYLICKFHFSPYYNFIVKICPLNTFPVTYIINLNT